jgi:hypothetical protein
MSRPQTISVILKDVARNIAVVYPFVLFFYIVAIVSGHFYKPVGQIFYWPGFHGTMLFLTLVVLLSGQFSSLLSHPKNFFGLIWSRVARLNKVDCLKIGILAVGLAIAIYLQVPVFPEGAILAYGLISFLWIITSRIAAILALAMLIVCGFSAALKFPEISNISALYAFYFLIIAVLTQIRESRKIA